MTLLISFFGLEFWQNLVTTILGAIIGILIALWLDRKSQRARKSQKTLQVLKLIHTSLEQNLKLIKQLEQGSNIENLIPSYNLDLVLMNSVSAIKYELIDNTELLGKIDWAHYQIQHISRLVDGLWEVGLRHDKNQARGLTLDIRSLCKENTGYIQVVIDDLKKEIKKYSSRNLASNVNF